MLPSPRRIRRPAHHIRVSATVALVFCTGACGSDSDAGDDGLPASTTYAGFVATSVGQTGPLNLAFAAPVAAPPATHHAGTGPDLASTGPVSVSGTMQLGGGPVINIAGTLDAGALEATTDGGYTLTATLDAGVLTGGLEGPGTITGHLVAASSGESSPVRAFCGAFDGEDTDAANTAVTGTFSVAMAGGRAAGALYFWTADGPGVFEYDTLSVFFAGTSTSSTLAVAQTDPLSGHLFTVTGNYDATTLSGSLREVDGEVPYLFGDFTGTACD